MEQQTLTLHISGLSVRITFAPESNMDILEEAKQMLLTHYEQGNHALIGILALPLPILHNNIYEMLRERTQTHLGNYIHGLKHNLSVGNDDLRRTNYV